MDKIEFTFIDEEKEKILVIHYIFMIAEHYGIIYQ